MTKVAVYRNLHNGMFSIQCREAPYYGKVIAHAKVVGINNPLFVVRENGRQKVLRERKKNVHAFVVGELSMFNQGHVRDEYRELVDDLSPLYKGQCPSTMFAERIEYNPYLYDSFVFADHDGMSKVDSASSVFMDVENGMYAWDVI